MAVRAKGGWESYLTRLRAAGFDSESDNLACVVGSGGAPEFPALPPPEASGRENRGSDAREWAALRGRLLVRSGRLDEALALLRGAANAPGGGRLPARTWLGEALLLSGRFAEAIRELEGARAEEKSYPWTCFFRAAARLGLGDGEGAAADGAEFMKSGPRAAALALRALIWARRGRWEQAGKDLSEAASLASGKAWPWALLAAVRRSGADLPGAKHALCEGLSREATPAIHLELARVYEQLGNIPEALRHAGEAARLHPCPDCHGLKARLHVCWREYDLGASEYTKALAFGMSPGVLFMRSRARSCAGRLGLARRDAELALRRSPGDWNLSAWRIQLMTAQGSAAQARRALREFVRASKGDPTAAALQSFLRAYMLLWRKDYRQAREELDRCRKESGGSALGLKAGFYRTLALILSSPPRREPPPGLHLVGLGVNPPYSATSEALRTLAQCDVVFNNVMDEEIFELIRPLCRDARPVAYHQNGDEGALSDEMLAELRPGRRVAFVTRGNAIVFGPLGSEMLRRLAGKSPGAHCVGAVCSFDLFGAKDARPPGPSGALALDSSGIGPQSVADPGAALTLFLDMRALAESAQAFCFRLRHLLGAERPALIFDHVVAQEPLRRTAGELIGLWKSLSPSAILHFPARKAR